MICKLIILIIALAFGYLGYTKTWYPSWALLFNVLVSVYIGVMSAPQLVARITFLGDYFDKYAYAFTMLTVALIVFVIIQFLSHKFFTSVYSVSFPVFFNDIGAGIIGFFIGVVVAGFLFFLVNATPLAEIYIVRFFTNPVAKDTKSDSIAMRACDFVHRISLQPCPVSVEKQMCIICSDDVTPTKVAAKPKAEKPLVADVPLQVEIFEDVNLPKAAVIADSEPKTPSVVTEVADFNIPADIKIFATTDDKLPKEPNK